MEDIPIKKPTERQQYKLLPPSEKDFVEFSYDKSKEYNPNTILQYNNRIKYRVTNAITEIAWLCEKLPKEQLKKVFSDEQIEDLLKITEKALKINGKIPQETHLKLHVKTTASLTE